MLTADSKLYCRAENELSYQDMPRFDEHSAFTSSKKAASAAKLKGACRTVVRWNERSRGDARQRDINYLWMDTVCINKQNPFELSSSINSMYNWYRQADVCFAYLFDFQDNDPSKEVPTFTQSKWFTRGWTLQELVAPKNVMFFDRHWKYIGDRESLQPMLTSRTKIGRHFLIRSDDIGRASVSQRMSWFSGRQTTVPEDTAYCLLGLFGVNMPLLYGEGAERAFRRLQEEIMRYSDDHSLFAWIDKRPLASATGLLAGSPLDFQDSGGYVHRASQEIDQPFQMTNKGIHIQFYVQARSDGYVASFDCLHDESCYLGMYLKRHSNGTDRYYRVQSNRLCRVDKNGRGNPTWIYVKALDEL